MDVGLNALIRYRLAENKHFAINEENGIIFALPNCMVAEEETTVQLEVRAIDRDGADDGLQSSIQLLVHRLNVEHVLRLTFVDNDQRSVDEVIEHVRAEVKVNFSVLRVAAVPGEVEEGESTTTEVEISSTTSAVSQALQQWQQDNANIEQIVYKMLVYAFHSSGRLQTTDELLR